MKDESIRTELTQSEYAWREVRSLSAELATLRRRRGKRDDPLLEALISELKRELHEWTKRARQIDARKHACLA